MKLISFETPFFTIDQILLAATTTTTYVTFIQITNTEQYTRHKTKTKSLSHSQQWALNVLHRDRLSDFIARDESIQLSSVRIEVRIWYTSFIYVYLFELCSNIHYTSYYNNNNNMWESIGGARIQWDHNGYSIIKIILAHKRDEKPEARRKFDEKKKYRRCNAAYSFVWWCNVN